MAKQPTHTAHICCCGTPSIFSTPDTIFLSLTRRATMSLAERRRKAKAIEEAGAALSVKLVARSTRGQRISELQGEDAEADETFWGQGAWQEAEDGDSEFSSEEGEKAREILQRVPLLLCVLFCPVNCAGEE